MRSLDPPEFDLSEIYDTLESAIAEPLKQRIVDSKQHGKNSEGSFDQNGTDGTFFMQPASQLCGDLTKAEMRAIYESHMVKMKGCLRSYYDDLMSLTSFDRCPFCWVGTVSTVDHYLPKYKYVDLAITPANLVASCRDCNSFKHTRYPRNRGQEFFHPYYDDVSSFKWLHCSIEQHDGPVPVFYVDTGGNLAGDEQDRIIFTFEKMRLDRLYSSNASNQLITERENFETIFPSDGTQGILDDITYNRDKYVRVNANSWQAALYEAMLQSAWYHTTGWQEI